MLQQTSWDWDKSVSVKQQIKYFILYTPLLQINLKTSHWKCVPDRQYQTAVFAKVFRFLPDIRSGKQIFFTGPNKNLPDRIKRADLVKKKHTQTKTNNRIIIVFTVLYQKQYTLTSLKFNLCYICKFKQKCPVLIFNHIFSPLFPFDTELLCRSVGIIFFSFFLS